MGRSLVEEAVSLWWATSGRDRGRCVREPEVLAAGVSSFGLTNGRDGGMELGVRCEDAVISVTVDARGRHKAGEPLEELNRREHDLGAAVGRGLG